MRTFTKLIASAALAAPLFAALPASAQDETGAAACGNIDVSASATCEVKVGAECKAECTPISFEAECWARAEAECNGKCTAEPIEVECAAECEASCNASCSGGFDCDAQCTADAEAQCAAQCEGAGSAETTENGGQASARAQCEADCSASISASCSANCEGSPPECEGGCEASCNGSCEVKGGVDCNIECQGSLEAGCTAELQGGCEVQCDAEGAAFCDGQYVDSGNNLEECVNYLNSIGFNIDFEASGTSSCEGNSCEAEGTASCSCDVPGANTSSSAYGAGFMAGLAALGAVFARRRRNAK